MAETKKTRARKKTVGRKLTAAAAQLIKMAEEGGVEQNFFFTTTFERYKVQLATLDGLQKEIEEGELLIKKEYIKGRENLVANPAITEYNKTATAANQTVTTLLKIIQTFADGPVMNANAQDEDDCDL